jgi:enamine deaminase RidA (YjgF/YER057c/UK114 family)
MRVDGTLAQRAAGQLDVALANVLANLAAADMDVSDLVKLTLYFVEEVDAPSVRRSSGAGSAAIARR